MSTADDRPIVLLASTLPATRSAGPPASLLAWLRGAGPRPPVQAEPRAVPPFPDLPRGALLIVDGLLPWRTDELARRLERRPDCGVVAVLGRPPALDWPEYLDEPSAAALARIRRSATTVVVPDAEAGAQLSSSGTGGGQPRILVDPGIPSRLAGTSDMPLPDAPALNLPPFLLASGPSDARANTPLLLQLWRASLARGQALPRLVLLGGRGTQVEEVAPLLDWNQSLHAHVAEAPPLSPGALRTLVRAARAVLAPDFCAPDMPLMRDAAALGTPVIAADTPQARVLDLQHRLSPIDGPGWRGAIEKAAAVRTTPTVVPGLPDWPALLARLSTLATSSPP